MTNYRLVNELQKQIIRKFKRRKVYSSFGDNVWGVDLVDMKSLSKYNRAIRYSLRVIDLFSKYAWVVPLKDKRGISIANAFRKIISKGCKSNRIWVDQGCEFKNYLSKIFLVNNNVEMYSTYNKGKSAVAERFIWTLKNKIYKHVTAASGDAYFDILDDTVKNTITQSIELLKWNQMMLHLILMLNTMLILMKKILK